MVASEDQAPMIAMGLPSSSRFRRSARPRIRFRNQRRGAHLPLASIAPSARGAFARAPRTPAADGVARVKNDRSILNDPSESEIWGHRNKAPHAPAQRSRRFSASPAGLSRFACLPHSVRLARRRGGLCGGLGHMLGDRARRQTRPCRLRGRASCLRRREPERACGVRGCSSMAASPFSLPPDGLPPRAWRSTAARWRCVALIAAPAGSRLRRTRRRKSASAC